MRLAACYFFILLLLTLKPCFAIAKVSESTAINCILGEARGEGFRGMVAVAEVLRRRGSTKGFVGCGYRSGGVNKTIRAKARKAWRLSRKTNYSLRATHFDSLDFSRPWWSYKMQRVTRIGKHIFYKE